MSRFALPALLALLSSAALAGTPVELQGHRGARGLFPENTLLGFQRAAELGVDVLELDVGMSRDGVVVISHDPVPNPAITRWKGTGNFVAPGQPPLHRMTFSRIQSYDVGKIRPGTGYSKRFQQQTSIEGATMPSLLALLNWLASSPHEKPRLNIEVKTDPQHRALTASPGEMVHAVLRDLKATGLLRRAVLQSFDFRAITAAKAQSPGTPLSCLTSQDPEEDTVQVGRSGPSPWLGGLDVDDFGGSVPRLVKAAGCSIWSPFFKDLSPAALAEAHALGLRVIVWTVNEEAEMKQLAQLGVDGIITDYPDRARRALGL